MCGLRSKIFRQAVQKFCRLAVVSQGIFVQHDENIFKQGVRRNLCGVDLKSPYGCLEAVFGNIVPEALGFNLKEIVLSGVEPA